MRLVVLVLACVLAAGIHYSFGAAGAAYTETVSPSVQIGNTLSLSLNNVANVQWGMQSAGSNLIGTIEARITANTNWTLTVQATDGYPGTNELTDENHRIAASNFKYTSSAGSPAPPAGNGTTTATSFDGSNQTDVWAGGTPTADSGVDITYTLNIPGSQQPGTYAATHTYTVTGS